MKLVRSLLAVVLLALAASAAFLGLGAHWVHRTATTQDALPAILAPVPKDPRVISALTGELISALQERVPPAAGLIPGFQDQLDSLIADAIETAMADPGVDVAWRTSVDLSRASFISDLAAVREGSLEAPTIWLEMSPFVALGRDTLYARTDSSLHRYLDLIDWPTDLRVALGRPDTHSAMLAADGLAVAQHWRSYYAAAAILALLGLALGSRRGRWGALLAVAVASLGAMALATLALGRVAATGGESLAGALKASLITGSVAALADFAQPAWFVAGGAALLGAVGLLVTLLQSKA